MRKDKTPSIYLYNSDKKTGQVNDQVSEQASGQYKKEILKRNIKNNNISKDIYVSTGVDLVIEK